MKEFNSQIEQRYLKKMVSELNHDSELNLGTYLSVCILETDRAIRIDNNEVVFIFNKNIYNGKDFMNDLSGLVSFIEVLKKNDLIFVHANPEILRKSEATLPENQGLTKDKLFQEKLNKFPENYGYWKIPTNLSEYVLEYIYQFVFIRPELIEYVNKKFRTPEQIRFRKTILWAWITAFIAFLGLLIALCK